MYLSSQHLSNLSSAYRGGVLNLTEGKECGCKKCKRCKDKARVRLGLMPLPMVHPDRINQNQDNEDNSDSGDEGGAEGMAEMTELEVANLIVEKTVSLLGAFNADECLEVLSSFLEMRGLEVRYSDLVQMVYEMDDWRKHPDAANASPAFKAKLQQRQRDREQRRRDQLSQAATPQAKQNLIAKHRDQDQRAKQRSQETMRNRQAAARKQLSQKKPGTPYGSELMSPGERQRRAAGRGPIRIPKKVQSAYNKAVDYRADIARGALKMGASAAKAVGKAGLAAGKAVGNKALSTANAARKAAPSAAKAALNQTKDQKNTPKPSNSQKLGGPRVIDHAGGTPHK